MTHELSTTQLVSALKASHRDLAAVLADLDEGAVTGGSYHAWTIAEVASHLGSGAEIFGLVLDAGRNGTPAPSGPDFQPIWAVWNDKDPLAQVRESVTSTQAFLDQVDALSDDELAAWKVDLFGSEQTMDGMLLMRLSEHALHSWDIRVALDPAATLPADATTLLVDHNLERVASRTGKPADEPRTITVHTTDPDRDVRIDVGPDGAQLVLADDPIAEPDLTIPAEAFLRLIAGRMDPAHTPASVASGPELDLLRRTFQGF